MSSPEEPATSTPTAQLAALPVTSPAVTDVVLGTSPQLLPTLPREIGGRDGPEPTRYGDWEKAGRCIDF